MSLYRDELDAARLRIEALETDLRARDEALRARELALEEHEAELSRLRRIAAVGTTLPPGGRPASPARHSVWAVAFAALACSTAASAAYLVLPAPAAVLLDPPPPTPLLADPAPEMAPVSLGRDEGPASRPPRAPRARSPGGDRARSTPSR